VGRDTLWMMLCGSRTCSGTRMTTWNGYWSARRWLTFFQWTCRRLQKIEIATYMYVFFKTSSYKETEQVQKSQYQEKNDRWRKSSCKRKGPVKKSWLQEQYDHRNKSLNSIKVKDQNRKASHIKSCTSKEKSTRSAKDLSRKNAYRK